MCRKEGDNEFMNIVASEIADEVILWTFLFSALLLSVTVVAIIDISCVHYLLQHL